MTTMALPVDVKLMSQIVTDARAIFDEGSSHKLPGEERQLILKPSYCVSEAPLPY